MNKILKIIAVTLSASLLLLGCSVDEPERPEADKVLEETSSTASSTDTEKDATEDAAKDTTKDTTKDTPKEGVVIDLKMVQVDVASLSLNENIHINQIGYRTSATKQVLVNGQADYFAVIDKDSGEQIFAAALEKGARDAGSEDNLYVGDFTKVRDSGAYYIAVPGIGMTDSFRIGEDVYEDLKRGLLKSFYFQRCGMDLDRKFAGDWEHKACHTSKGKIYGNEEVEMDGNGGWHDAGDYGKYVVPGAVAVADLLMTWELFPNSCKDDINIPESGNGLPDILDEARYKLEWLLKMQDDDTGGVYHKLTSKSFPSLALMPQDDTSELFYSPISAAATADFAAVTAMASRIFENYDRQFGQLCLKASEKAWIWLENNKAAHGFKNPGEISTGEYGDSNYYDERLWAAAELYRATGDSKYGEFFKSAYSTSGLRSFEFGWQSVGGYAGLAYLFTDESKQDKAVYDYVKMSLINAAKDRLRNSQMSGYNITLGFGDYYWGSNMKVLNDARLLILADMLEPSKDYIDAAASNFNYILGCNTLDQCYVTGFGHKPVLDPHHRPSKGDSVELPVPGLVAGGPNSGLQDEFARINLKGLPPAKCYIDYSGSYSTNEVTIYWNSPAVFVAAAFSEPERSFYALP